MTRRRLSPEDRRAQLLALGAELFASLPYDEVHIEAVAEQAGVSRGLLYHYFPTKRAFFAALVREGAARMAADTEPDIGLAADRAAATAAYAATCCTCASTGTSPEPSTAAPPAGTPRSRR